MERATRKTLCRDLQNETEATQLNWESQAASRHSPGVIDTAEKLARQVLDPVYFNSITRELKPSFFDDATSSGASVNRLKHISAKQLHAHGIARAEASSTVQKTRQYIGFVTVSAGAARKILVSQKDGDGKDTLRRAFGIYDTALENDPSHADICQLVKSGEAARAARLSLFELVKSTLEQPTDSADELDAGSGTPHPGSQPGPSKVKDAFLKAWKKKMTTILLRLLRRDLQLDRSDSRDLT